MEHLYLFLYTGQMGIPLQAGIKLSEFKSLPFTRE